MGPHPGRGGVRVRSSPERTAGRAWLPVALRLCVAALLLFGVFRFQAGIRATVAALAGATLGLLAASLAVRLAGKLVSAFKWFLMLRMAGIDVQLGRVVYVSFVGSFYGQFAPGSVAGDVARMLLLARESGGKAPALASAFMQRNTGLFGLLVIANGAAWVWPVQVRLFPPAVGLLNDIRAWFALVTFAYVAVNAVLLSGRAVGFLWGRFGEKGEAAGKPGMTRGFVDGALRRAARLHSAMLPFRSSLPVAIALSLVTQIADCVSIYLAGLALGLPLGFGYYCVFVPISSLVALIPITVNGLGLREAVYGELFGAVGQDPATAVALGLVQFACNLVLSLVGGVWHALCPVEHRLDVGSAPDGENPS